MFTSLRLALTVHYVDIKLTRESSTIMQHLIFTLHLIAAHKWSHIYFIKKHQGACGVTGGVAQSSALFGRKRKPSVIVLWLPQQFGFYFSFRRTVWNVCYGKCCAINKLHCYIIIALLSHSVSLIAGSRSHGSQAQQETVKESNATVCVWTYCTGLYGKMSSR